MHGVSEVIAIILILMITISLAGLAYMFMSTTMADVTASTGSTIDTTASSMLTSFNIESMDSNILYIRNTGQSAISNVSVYVNDLPVNSKMIPSSIPSGTVASIAVIGYVKEGDTIKIATQNGFSVSKKAPDQCHGAIACWRFDQGSGGVANDSSLNGNSGSLVSMNNSGNNLNGTVSSGWTVGRFGKALGFDGVNDYFDAGNRPSLNFLNTTRALAVSAWVYPINHTYHSSNQWYLVHKWSYPISGWVLIMRNGGVVCFSTYDGTSHSACTSAGISVNQWTHLVGWSNGTTNKIFVNGVENATIASGTVMEANIELRMATWVPDYTFNGTMDEVMLWDHTLSLEEIVKLYNRPPY